jgi:hypothetical protein
MLTIEKATIELSQYTQKFILKNNIEFDSDDFKEILIAACTVYHFNIIRQYTSPTDGSWLQNMTSVWSDTEMIINKFLIAAQKLMPPLYRQLNDEEITERVFDWSEDENLKIFIKISDKIFDFDVRTTFPDFV